MLTATEVEQWLEEHDLTACSSVRFLEEEVLLHRMEDTVGLPYLLRAFPNYLRSQGSYALLLQRAQEKQQVLAEVGRTTPSLLEVGISEEALFQWYFEEVLLTENREDSGAYARALEYTNASDMITALLREYC